MSFDFKEKAAVLFQKLGQTSGRPLAPDLGRAALELALREAYAQGLKDAGDRTQPRQTPARAPFPSTPKKSHPSNATPSSPPECEHVWEEAFLDGRSVGSKCIHCEILLKDVQNRCDHYYVSVAGVETCVACRKRKSAAQKAR